MKIKGQEFFVSIQKVQSVVFIVAVHVVIAVNSLRSWNKVCLFSKNQSNRASLPLITCLACLLTHLINKMNFLKPAYFHYDWLFTGLHYHEMVVW